MPRTHSAWKGRPHRAASTRPLAAGGSRRRLAAACAAAVWLLTAVGPVGAHSELVSSAPVANSSLTEAPDELRLTFTEPIDPGTAVVELLDEQQTVVDGVGAVQTFEGGLGATVSLPALDPGVYVVRYQVLSTVDGHVTGGSFAFQIDPSGSAPPPAVAPTTESPSVDLATVIARWVALAGALTLFGSAFFWAVTARPVLRDAGLGTGRPAVWRLLGGAALAAFAGLATFLTLAARDLPASHHGSGGGGVDFAAPFGWTQFGIAMRVAEVGSILAFLLAAFWSFRQAERRQREPDAADPPREALAQLAILGFGVVTLAGFSLAGHVAALGGLGYAALDLAHLLGVGVWLGTLPGYLVLSARYAGALDPAARRDLLGAVIRRHSRFALLAAPVVALTGIANSPLVLGDSRALVASDYGNLLLGKALLFSIAVAIGAANYFLVRRLALRPLLFTIGAEVCVAALAVLTAAGLVTVPAAASRAPQLVAAEVPTAHLYGEIGPDAVHAIVSVPAPGLQTYQVAVSDAATGQPSADLQRVYLTFVPPAGSRLSEERVELTTTDVPGLYQTAGAYTPVIGEWGIEVTIRRAGVRDETLEFDVPVTTAAPPEQLPPADTGIGTPAPLAALWRLVPPTPYEWLPALSLLGLAGILWLVGPTRGRADDGHGRSLRAMRTAALALGVGTALVTGSQMLVRTANAEVDAALPTENPVAATAESVDAGERAYLATCASCHGVDGLGGGPAADGLAVPPVSLPAHVPFHSDAELFAIVTRGISGTPMPGFATELSPEDRWDLINYLRTRWPQP